MPTPYVKYESHIIFMFTLCVQDKRQRRREYGRIDAVYSAWITTFARPRYDIRRVMVFWGG